MLLKLVALAAVFAASLVAAPIAGAAEAMKIGFVNAAKILDKAPQAEQARNRLEKEFAPRDKELVDQQKSLRKVEERLAKDGAVMGDSERANLEREVVAKRRDLKRAQDEFREDFNLRRNEELGKLQKRVFDVIVALAREEHFDLIVNDAAVIYASDRIEITDKVLSRLGGER